MFWECLRNNSKNYELLVHENFTLPNSSLNSFVLEGALSKLNHKGYRNKGNDHKLKKALDCSTNSPYLHFRRCIENSIENVFTDVRVKRVKNF